ncbi:MAG: LamG domain-containing protein [Firmicutes bacterium]|nr:LamG domain-containing protein [Bacillota bacterium]
MKKRKILSVLLALVIASGVFTLTACFGGNNRPGRGLQPIPRGGNGQDISSQGLEAHWQFESLVDGVIPDLSGGNRPLSVIGNPNFTEGVSGNAFRLDGQTALTFPADRYLQTAGDLSIAFWINIAGFTPPYQGADTSTFNLWQNTIIDVEGGLAAMFTPFLVTVSLIWDLDNPGVVLLRATAAGSGGPFGQAGQDALLTDATEDINISEHLNEWMHVAIVWQNAVDWDNSGTLTIYLNSFTNEFRQVDMFHGDGGPKMLGNTDQRSAFASRTTIGAWIDGGTVRRGGLYSLDDMRIYSRAITSAEVLALAQLHN